MKLGAKNTSRHSFGEYSSATRGCCLETIEYSTIRVYIKIEIVHVLINCCVFHRPQNDYQLQVAFCHNRQPVPHNSWTLLWQLRFWSTWFTTADFWQWNTVWLYVMLLGWWWYNIYLRLNLSVLPKAELLSMEELNSSTLRKAELLSMEIKLACCCRQGRTAFNGLRSSSSVPGKPELSDDNNTEEINSSVPGKPELLSMEATKINKQISFATTCIHLQKSLELWNSSDEASEIGGSSRMDGTTTIDDLCKF